MNFLGLHIITIGLLVFYANVTATTEPKPTLYVFGDSMSDIGKFGQLVYGIAPRYPYWQYRFSSGPYNMAIGMSTANRTRGWHLSFAPTRILPSTLDQIHSFKRLTLDFKLQTVSAKDIVVLEIGANDYLFMLDEITSGRTSPAEFAHDLVSDVKQQVGLLQQIGFSNIVITNLPLMQYMPAARYLDCEVVTARVVESYNSELSRQFSNWAQVSGLNSFISIDMARFFELAIMPSISSALGLVDTTSSCVGANIFNLLEPSTNRTEGIMKLFIDP
ncbi:hypothetical protein DL89DRAFT_266766 [Linderina pennispora]|uniref:SGNH hydrolase n=1 Tax=Linderina pennispora TaxID=61395 RepID=A0A1Y1WB20_9FUNG|nr:uncharacterized protein DL89DRAFT_266766 [Linderina pennispora]ORX70565.1 hypothetical protein DL89DRAFT_266766 [Linderina pennispora]